MWRWAKHIVIAGKQIHNRCFFVCVNIILYVEVDLACAYIIIDYVKKNIRGNPKKN